MLSLLTSNKIRQTKELISVRIKYVLNFYLIQSLIWLHGLSQIVEWDEVTLFRSYNMCLLQQNDTWMLQHKLSNPSHHPERLLCKIFWLKMIHFLNLFVVESCNHLKYTIHCQTNRHQSNPGNFKEWWLCNFFSQDLSISTCSMYSRILCKFRDNYHNAFTKACHLFFVWLYSYFKILLRLNNRQMHLMILISK